MIRRPWSIFSAALRPSRIPKSQDLDHDAHHLQQKLDHYWLNNHHKHFERQIGRRVIFSTSESHRQ